ncbi:MAG: hypothetical protein KJ593_06985 [Candidatus Omnitrophica bacterium]|nr:hypothetical protein [Candidatus Omnitrophota bacterium]
MNPDFTKLLVVLVAFFYLASRLKSNISTINYRLISIGFLFLLFAAVLDFSDGFKQLEHTPILGEKAHFHDFLEDQIGDTLGLALFALGAFRELKRRL